MEDEGNGSKSGGDLMICPTDITKWVLFIIDVRITRRATGVWDGDKETASSMKITSP